MSKLWKFFALGTSIGALTLLALLIVLGGKNKVTLSEEINRSLTLIPETIQLPNLTEKLANQVARTVVAKNPQGPTINGATLPSAAEIAAQTIESELKNFNPGDLWPIIEEKRLLIIEQPQDADRTSYFVALQKALSAERGVVLKTGEMPTKEAFLDASHRFKNAMAAAADIPTPRDLLDMQIQALEILGAQANCFELLANYEADPVKALLATETQKSITQETQDLSQKMVSYIQEHGLTF